MTEVWKDIFGYEGLYQISNTGKVKSLYRKVNMKNDFLKTIPERIMRPIHHSGGYLQIVLTKQGNPKHCFIHRLVAQTFVSNLDNKPQVNHKNGNKQDNNASNLEWVTSSENHFHSVELGLTPVGEKHKKSKLTEYDVLSILSMLKQGCKQSTVAKIFGVQQSIISKIKLGLRWKHLVGASV